MPIEMTKNYRWTRQSKRKFDRRSFRVKRAPSHKGEKSVHLLRLACPKGKWQPRSKKCSVGMVLEAIGRRMR